MKNQIEILDVNKFFPQSEDSLFNEIKADYWNAFNRACEKYDDRLDDQDFDYDTAVKEELKRNGYERVKGGVETPKYSVVFRGNFAEITKK